MTDFAQAALPVGDQRTLPYPSALAKLNCPRACYRCHEVKPAEGFDLGPSNRKRLRVCRECMARENAEREQREAARRATWVDPHTGRIVRRCAGCREVKPLGSDYYIDRPRAHSFAAKRAHYCKACTVARTTEAHRQLRKRDPERASALESAAQRRYRARLRADAERRERIKAVRRARYRRRRVEAGLSVRPPATPGELRTIRGDSKRLPAGPLVAVLERTRARTGYSREEWCERIGVTPRSYGAWLTGERPTVDPDTADTVLCRTSLLFWDVWPEGTEGHVRAKAYFCGTADGDALR